MDQSQGRAYLERIWKENPTMNIWRRQELKNLFFVEVFYVDGEETRGTLGG